HPPVPPPFPTRRSSDLACGNEHLLVYVRSNPADAADTVVVVANFDARPQHLDLDDLGSRLRLPVARPRDLASGEAPAIHNNHLVDRKSTRLNSSHVKIS